MKLPITVHILYQRDFVEGNSVYTRLYKLLCRDYKEPFSSGIDIPVYFSTDDEAGMIEDVDTSISEKTYILLLVDQNMYLSDAWKKYVNDKLIKYKSDDNIKVYAVGLYKYAFELSSRLSKNQFIGFDTDSLLSVWDEFKTRLFDTLIRFLQDYNKNTDGIVKQQTIFISHAKRDGKLLAESLRDYLLHSGTKLSSFFDVNSIMEGYNFEDQLLDNVKGSLMIVIFTSAYSSREWCIKEIMKAKQEQRPVIVVFAVDGVIDRTFPYIGNIPAMSYSGDWLPVVNLLLQTTLNQFHQEKLLKGLKKEGTEVMPTTPDAFSLSFIAEKPNDADLKVVYPEPPIGKDEMSLLLKVRGGTKTKFQTPIQYESEGVNLLGRNIAISISDSEDQFSTGIGQEMLKDVTIEIIRHIFIANGKIVYGGNIQENGYTDLFRELSLQYSQYLQNVKEQGPDDHPEDERYVTSFIAWPYHTKLTRDDICNFRHSRVELRFTEPGHDASDSEKKNGMYPCSKAEEKRKLSAALTKMRTIIEEYEVPDQNGAKQQILARIFIGGKIHSSNGITPGILEEFMLALSHKRPIFLLGGFGGQTKLIADHVKGFEKKPINGLEQISYADLNNGVTDKNEIEILNTSTNILEIVPIVLRALGNLANKGNS